jgi:hypothetical protein
MCQKPSNGGEAYSMRAWLSSQNYALEKVLTGVIGICQLLMLVML